MSSKAINHLLERNVSEVIVKTDLKKQLEDKKKLKVYLGVDPSGPTIHLGHAVVLRKLKEFQDLGHEIILLIGDFTAQIGDPTGNSKTRVPLSKAEIAKNFHDYQAQATKIIAFDGDNPAQIRFNSSWLGKLTFEDLIKYAACFTVQQMLERDMFEKRIKEEKPIGLHEFFYPLMQGYDSVALEADVEIGGTDQTFNMLCGRTLRQKLDSQDKQVLTVPLLLGTDGRKMSKSFHNDIGINESPKEQFGKIMSMKDELIIDYFKLCTNLNVDEIKLINKSLEKGENPRNIKARLGLEIVTLYHGEEAAKKASEEFDQIFKDKKKPSQIPVLDLTAQPVPVVDLVASADSTASRGEIKRLCKQGGIKINNQKEIDFQKKITPKTGMILQIGKRKFFEIKIK
ncbi:tyrosine--tRNA ligase [Patescibacteria group bacterium]|nr:tyrosine--tRNA ligase [Patescibacteria group bacterium]